MNNDITIASLCLVFLVVLAGCATPTDFMFGVVPSESVPNPPETVTNETAREYVRTAHEARILNNRILAHPGNANVGCIPLNVAAKPGVRVIYAWCTGIIESGQGGHIDLVTSALYWVEAGDTRHASAYSSQNAEITEYSPGQNFTSYGLYNFEKKSNDINVTLSHSTNGSRFATLSSSLGPQSGVTTSFIPYENENTTYIVSVHTANENHSFRWQPGQRKGQIGPRLFIWVTPSGKLSHGIRTSITRVKGYQILHKMRTGRLHSARIPVRADTKGSV